MEPEARAMSVVLAAVDQVPGGGNGTPVTDLDASCS